MRERDMYNTRLMPFKHLFIVFRKKEGAGHWHQDILWEEKKRERKKRILIPLFYPLTWKGPKLCFSFMLDFLAAWSSSFFYFCGLSFFTWFCFWYSFFLPVSFTFFILKFSCFISSSFDSFVPVKKLTALSSHVCHSEDSFLPTHTKSEMTRCVISSLSLFLL